MVTGTTGALGEIRQREGKVDMGWSEWFKIGGGEEMATKETKDESGKVTREENLRTNDGDRQDHQHTYISYDDGGDIESGGATPGKSTDADEPEK